MYKENTGSYRVKNSNAVKDFLIYLWYVSAGGSNVVLYMHMLVNQILKYRTTSSANFSIFCIKKLSKKID